MNRFALIGLLALSTIPATPVLAQASNAQTTPTLATQLAQLDSDMESWMRDNNVPGVVWGIVQNGKLMHVRSFGFQDVQNKAPVSADTAFRIASMSKAFTGHAILKLRDQGKLRLDDPVWMHVPEVKSWASDMTVADLLYHTAGFVTDDPWGDRQQPMPEAEFTQLLKAGVPRTTRLGTRFEYSNFGYALLGRIIGNKAKTNFANYVTAQVFQPLGMASTTYEVGSVPKARLAIGYRWEEGAYLQEPSMAHGAFGSMGGIVTTANDYAKWVAYLLEGLKPDAQAKAGKANIWDMQRGGGFPQARRRSGKSAPECKVSAVYAAGLIAGNDCVLGPVLFHGGGFPGYGSHMLLIPDTGTGIFALSNRTYAGPSGPVWDAATVLIKSGQIVPTPAPASALLNESYAVAKTIWKDRSLNNVKKSSLAMNFLMDRSETIWAKRLEDVYAQAGTCDVNAGIKPTGNLSGSFEWTCEKGKIKGSLLLAPTFSAQIQSLTYDFVK
jgi:serine-type D-Ala-D-Ala carboxypeptidase/endopeptidase